MPAAAWPLASPARWWHVRRGGLGITAFRSAFMQDKRKLGIGFAIGIAVGTLIYRVIFGG
jgi:hypothetical protein